MRDKRIIAFSSHPTYQKQLNVQTQAAAHNILALRKHDITHNTPNDPFMKVVNEEISHELLLPRGLEEEGEMCELVSSYDDGE